MATYLMFIGFGYVPTYISGNLKGKAESMRSTRGPAPALLALLATLGGETAALSVEAGKTPQPDTFYVNSAYLIMEGAVVRDWGYRVASEVSTTTGGPNARLETTYVEWKTFKAFRAASGKAPSPIRPP
jgi:hypothetical protein